MILTRGIFQLKTSQIEWKQLNHFLNERYSWPIVMVPGVGGFICFTDGWWRDDGSDWWRVRWRRWRWPPAPSVRQVETGTRSVQQQQRCHLTNNQHHLNNWIIFVINHLFTVNFIISANTSIKRNILSIKTRYCYTIELYFKIVKLSGRRIVK